MTAQAQTIPSSAYESFMTAARRGDVLVADVFEALRRGEISEIECSDIIKTFERARVPAWQRFLVSSPS